MTALGSFLQARSNAGEWLVRMEDLDLTKNQAGVLDSFSLHWDGAVLYQTTRHEAYVEVLNLLKEQTVFCECSRKKLQHNQGVYDGKCRNDSFRKKARTIRLKTPDQIISFHDLIQGNYQQHLLKEVGDFVTKRKEFLTIV